MAWGLTVSNHSVNRWGEETVQTAWHHQEFLHYHNVDQATHTVFLGFMKNIRLSAVKLTSANNAQTICQNKWYYNSSFFYCGMHGGVYFFCRVAEMVLVYTSVNVLVLVHVQCVRLLSTAFEVTWPSPHLGSTETSDIKDVRWSRRRRSSSGGGKAEEWEVMEEENEEDGCHCLYKVLLSSGYQRAVLPSIKYFQNDVSHHQGSESAARGTAERNTFHHCKK